jgi:predicted RNase H-like nuclease (RuvC/YqgF family)
MTEYEKMKLERLEKQVWEFPYIKEGYKHHIRTLEAKVQDAEEERVEAEKRVDEHIEELEKVREDLRIALNVAERRADMIRDLVRENRELKRLQVQKPEITEEVIEEVTRVLKRHIEPVTVAPANANKFEWGF